MMRVAGLVVVGLLLVGCSSPAASFSATGPCNADGRAPGIYPDLEALLPVVLDGVAATIRDSGRNCSDTTLGTLKTHGITDLRFAGATWTPDGAPATVIAAFRSGDGLPNLQAGWVQEFYETGAHNSTKTENITVTQPTIGTTPVWRLDTLNNLSFQSVVVWPGDGIVHVVIVATDVGPDASLAVHETAVKDAVMAAAAAPTSSQLRIAREPVLVSAA